jgi:hypothetical protein
MSEEKVTRLEFVLFGLFMGCMFAMLVSMWIVMLVVSQ